MAAQQGAQQVCKRSMGCDGQLGDMGRLYSFGVGIEMMLFRNMGGRREDANAVK